ncbi:nucleoside-diphosphate-sugar epimerase [Lentinula raphanica]|nr:nucleoside-diphosphate-sugar epimerase [Lentinula raphanica]
MNPKVVICGAGFLGQLLLHAIHIELTSYTGKHIAQTLASRSTLTHHIQLASRNPQKLHALLKETLPYPPRILPPATIDITNSSTLLPAFSGASLVVSLVGIMHGSPADFERIQWKGAENVAKAAKEVGARLVHVSAIGADRESHIPYNRTKALGEEAVRDKDVVVLRPSIVFGPEDDFFNRFSKLSKFLPFLPVFGGGTSRFQPVYVGDIARAVEIIARNDPAINAMVGGKMIECGGPDVLTYKEIMKLVLKHNQRTRPIVSLPFWMGKLQGAVMERFPVNLFTVTRAQVEQLKSDNVVENFSSTGADYFPFDTLVEKYAVPGTRSPLNSVHDILPQYLS